MNIPRGMSPNFFPTWIRSTVWWKTKLAGGDKRIGEIRQVLHPPTHRCVIPLKCLYVRDDYTNESYRTDRCFWGNRSVFSRLGAAPGASLHDTGNTNTLKTFASARHAALDLGMNVDLNHPHLMAAARSQQLTVDIVDEARRPWYVVHDGSWDIRFVNLYLTSSHVCFHVFLFMRSTGSTFMHWT